MTQRYVIIGILLLLIVFSGCTEQAQAFSDSFLGKGQDGNSVPSSTSAPVTQVTLNPFTIEPEKMVYYFCDDKAAIYAQNPSLGAPEVVAENGYALCQQSLTTFVSFTDANSGIRCQFPALEDAVVASQLINLKHAGANVRIVFGKAYTMKFCETGCLPVVESQFTNILAEGLGVQFAEGVNESYCVNEKGVWFGSFIPSGRHNPINASSYAVYDTKFTEAYNARFREIWEN